MTELTAPWAWYQRLWVADLALRAYRRGWLPWGAFLWIDGKVWMPVANSAWWKERQRPLREAIKNGEVQIEWTDTPSRRR